LAKTVEYFRIPKDVLCICVGKSTYARTGIICNVTPIENEFEGNIVIELSNTTPNPAKIYSNEGIAQFLFFKSDTQPETTYKSKNGKYQGQTTIQVAKIKK
jgi:dCTP deaminase